MGGYICMYGEPEVTLRCSLGAIYLVWRGERWGRVGTWRPEVNASSFLSAILSSKTGCLTENSAY